MKCSDSLKILKCRKHKISEHVSLILLEDIVDEHLYLFKLTAGRPFFLLFLSKVSCCHRRKKQTPERGKKDPTKTNNNSPHRYGSSKNHFSRFSHKLISLVQMFASFANFADLIRLLKNLLCCFIAYKMIVNCLSHSYFLCSEWH